MCFICLDIIFLRLKDHYVEFKAPKKVSGINHGQKEAEKYFKVIEKINKSMDQTKRRQHERN
jgi:hypothetical protein